MLPGLVLAVAVAVAAAAVAAAPLPLPLLLATRMVRRGRGRVSRRAKCKVGDGVEGGFLGTTPQFIVYSAMFSN